MLYVFGFEKVSVVLSDLYFLDPHPKPGQEGAERGVRLEVRLIELGDPVGSIYAARPITVAHPVWRADLLETVDGPVGSFDRTHQHPLMRGWEPGGRVFDEALSADPVTRVGELLSDLDALVLQAVLPAEAIGPDDAREVREAVPEILEALRRLLSRVHAGELALAPPGDVAMARVSWL